MSGQNDRPVIIVELPGEEERAGKAVVFRAVMSVVLVSGDGVAPKAAVLGDIGGKLVVMAEDDRFAVTANRQLGRNGSVESPHCQRTLVGKIGMELGMNALAVLGVDLCAFLRGFNQDLRREFIKPLVRPILSRRTAFHGPRAAAQFRSHVDRCLIGYCGGGRSAAEIGLRSRSSKRSMGCVNASPLSPGLGGAPVGPFNGSDRRY